MKNDLIKLNQLINNLNKFLVDAKEGNLPNVVEENEIQKIAQVVELVRDQKEYLENMMGEV
jgi:hypothetical protein